jgi:hypothetical protein
MVSVIPKENSLTNDKKNKADRLDGFLEFVIQNNKDINFSPLNSCPLVTSLSMILLSKSSSPIRIHLL